MSNKSKLIKPNYHSKELLSALSVIQTNNELEKKQMEYENTYQIPEMTQKISIMEVLDQPSYNSRQDNPKMQPINEKCNNNRDNYLQEEDIDEPMTFNPRKHKKSQDASPEDNNTSSSQPLSPVNPNQFVVLIEDIKDRIRNEYQRIDQFSKHINKSLPYDIDSSAKIDMLNSIIDFIHQTHNSFWSIFAENERKLESIKESYHDPQLRRLEDSIFQVTDYINSEGDLFTSCNNKDSSNRIKSQLVNSSLLKSKELNTSVSDPIINHINEVDQISLMYKNKIISYQEQIGTQNQHIKHYQELLLQSKGLIDELYEKNRLLSMKVIKYKDIKEGYRNNDNQ